MANLTNEQHQDTAEAAGKYRQRVGRTPMGKEAERQKIAADLAAFRKNGGKIQQIPTGQSGQVYGVKKTTTIRKDGKKRTTHATVAEKGDGVRSQLQTPRE